MTFYDGTTQLGTGSVSFNTGNNDYEASFVTSALTIGRHNITARFAATSNYLGSTSPVIQEAVTIAPTTTTLTSSSPLVSGVGLSVYGQSVTYTATVSAAPGIAIPPGTVTFKDTSTGLAIASSGVNPTTGQVSFTTTTLPVGTQNVIAIYTPSSGMFHPSTSAALTQIVAADATNVAVNAAPNPAGLEAPVTLTAIVSAAAPGSGTPTGTVTFFNATTGSTLAANVALSGGTASINTSGFTFGANDIEVSYSGSTNFTANTGSTTEHVLYGTTTTVASSLNPIFTGNPVTFTATVAPGMGAPAGSATPTGSVTFYDNGVPLATSGLSNGSASFTATALSMGAHNITAVYSGDGSFYAPSTSPILVQGVYAPAASMKVKLARPRGTGTPFSVTARLYDSNGQLITQMGGEASITEIAGPDGGFTTPKSVFYKKGRFAFTGLRVSRGGLYTLQVTFGSLSMDVTFSVNGRAG